ncbi:dolichyl-diphosphooligosaccharide--protein glycosyltransferase subunit DAD1-like [Pelmatolapia mariae]|uniref:dolichyl-diphosphooligosaccharide--protein glycosyltransferase subunit DAD1-like n=1 Tax=Pelmatolapia mariae TaxID=158779 RepID=UPI003211F22D
MAFHQKGCRTLVYCLLVGTFPFNSFLSGFISCVGSFILAAVYFRPTRPPEDPAHVDREGQVFRRMQPMNLDTTIHTDNLTHARFRLPRDLLNCFFIQINPQNKGDFLSISPERAFADFLFAHTVLHLVVMNFIG